MHASLTYKDAPQLLGHMRCKWCQHLDQVDGNLPDQIAIDALAVLEYIEGIHQLHNRADSSIEHEAVANILRYLPDGGMENAAQFLFLIRQAADIVLILSALDFILKNLHNAPYTLQEAGSTSHALIAPIQVAVNRCRKQDKEACRIRTILGDNLLRRNHVALGLGHLAAILQHHALSQEVGKRLGEVHHACIPQHLGKEA